MAQQLKTIRSQRPFDTKGKIKKLKKESGGTAEVTVQKGTKGLVDLKDKIAEGATTGAIANSRRQGGLVRWRSRCAERKLMET